MERIKLLQHKALPFIIAIILFMIPFFWFKPGEMDLGGDSSRLYFYDPVSYFFTSTLYVVSSSSVGGPTLNYVNIPFIYLLIALKYIFTSPTILISGLYGISLSAGFIFCYLIIMELTESKKNNLYAAIAGGLVYVFFPALIDTWRHTLLTFNQIFLNPLIFYLLLKYFKTSRISILFVVIIITFIFSPNFSIAAVPGLFAFYPVSILFLVFYTKFILKRHIIVKHIFFGLLLFIGIQAFHVIPQISAIFSKGSGINSVIFSTEGKFDRGLSYFSAISPNIKASINLLGLPQMEPLNFFSNAFIVFPFIIVISLLFNKQKTILLTSFFFLVVLFFATANITNTWLSIYKWLFNVPGFSMFRNFFGQWIYAYMFFYSIIFGQALYIVLDTLRNSKSRLKKLLTFLLISVPILILVINATPLIKGDIIRQAIWQSNNVKWVLQIDPDYKQALSFVRSLPAEGRVLTLPLTDYGYQIIAGENGGAYLGPSTISYLAGKKDFSGYNELLGYENVILNLIKSGEIETLKRILGIINVKYVFYNADPIVYDQFPSFPYQRARGLPQDQRQYKKFIDSLNLHEIKNINNKFFVYEIPNDYYLPQVSVAKKSFNFNEPIAEIQTPLSLITKDNRIAINTNEENTINGVSVSEIKFDEMLTDLRRQSPFWTIITSTNKSDFDFPYASWGMNSLIYPIILQRENQQLSYTELDQAYIDRRIFLAEKRIAELQRWSKEASILGSVESIKEFDASWKEPNLWDTIFLQKYNYWEVSLLRYSRAMNELIDKIEKVSKNDNAFESNKDRIRRAIGADKDLLYRIIQVDEKLTTDQKIYIAKLSTDIFDSLTDRLQFTVPSLEKVTYNLGKLEAGNYIIDDVDKKLMLDTDQSKVKVDFNDNMIPIDNLEQDTNWLKLQNFQIKENDKNSFTLLLPKPMNFFSNTKWELAEKGNFATNYASLTISNIAKEKNGLLREIENWHEKSYYMLSFDYITYGKFFKLTLFDKTEGKNQKTTNLVEDILRSNNWKKYTAAIASSDDAISAYIQIHKIVNNDLFNVVEKDKGQDTKIDIRNLSIVKIPNPKIILRKVNTINDQDKKIPQITFTRINPIKYKVQVRNAFAPYTLVLFNQFDKKWKLVDPTQNTPTVKAFFSRFIASIGNMVMGMRKENAKSSNTQLTYFGGDVRENVSHDMFLNEKTFETWGKDEIAQFKHFPVNGFANAWYIEPSDMENKTDYSLIIEMSSQKLLYAGLIISISTAIFTLLLLVKFLKK